MFHNLIMFGVMLLILNVFQEQQKPIGSYHKPIYFAYKLLDHVTNFNLH
jgi:hypothetical protein